MSESSEDRSTRYVQTELPLEEYEHVREFASERGLSVKEATRQALRQWIDRQRRPDPNDPAFTVLDRLDRLDRLTGAVTDARELPDLIEMDDDVDTF